MPTYAYRCSGCGFEQDVMQKLADAPLTVCPGCKSETFVKQLTAAGIQLKGSGWYATDFKGGSKPAVESDNPPPCQGGTGSCACN
jgi:putative FmdB family regulatory protein